jgi:hypothetical protein
MFAYESNGIFHKYNFTAKTDTKFYLNQSVWGSMYIFSTILASLFSQDQSKAC